MRDTVAAPIEEQISGVEGMMYMSSRCTNDSAYNLTVTFKPGTDSDMAQVLVQNRVSLAIPVIPALVQNEGINVRKQSPSTLMIVNLISPDGSYDSTRLSNYATIYVKDELGRVPGIAGITYLGQRDYSLRAWLNPEKMAALKLSAQDVITAITQQNVQVAAGQIGQQPVPRGQQSQMPITTQGRLVEKEQFEDIILKTGQAALVSQFSTDSSDTAASSPDTSTSANASDTPTAGDQSTGIVRLRHVARVEFGSQQYDQTCTMDGRPSVALSIYQLPVRTRLNTADLVYAKMRTEIALPRRRGLPDRLRHDPIHSRIGQRSLFDCDAVILWPSSCSSSCKTGGP